MTKDNIKEERVYSSYSLFIIQGSQGRNLEAGTEAETMGDHYLLTPSLWVAQLNLLYTPELYAHGWHYPW